MLKVFSNNKFPGLYVGGAAVVIAESKEEALELLKTELDKHSLDSSDIRLQDMVELDLTTKAAIILHDGDY